MMKSTIASVALALLLAACADEGLSVGDTAVLVIAGDFAPSRAMSWVRKYFAGIPPRPRPEMPDLP